MPGLSLGSCVCLWVGGWVGGWVGEEDVGRASLEVRWSESVPVKDLKIC